MASGRSLGCSSKLALVLLLFALDRTHGGLIKDIYQKITHTNNQTENTVKQSAPICGSGTFSTPNEKALSPEIIFISNRPSRSVQVNSNDRDYSQDRRRESNNDQQGGRRPNQNNNDNRPSQHNSEVAKEFRFHGENVTLEELERHGFNPNAPVSFLMHGFTSGYPLQAWISAIVEAYTIDRETSSGGSTSGRPHQSSNSYNNQHGSRTNNGVSHNLFIVNWHYAARGILYPRAVANIPIVASYVTRFINDRLLNEARVDPRRIQLIGHSLGAHLAGFIGKNTRSKVGRIYGLDPAGPCFGTLAGPLYPSSKRLAPSDAEEVISIHTNSALLGIDKPLGRYSVYVEGGEKQPGCKGGGALASINAITFDGGDFDSIACSHSRAPNLLTYRHNQNDAEDDCQLVAYGCKDWESFVAGHCGVCESSAGRYTRAAGNSPTESVECIRIGLDWQYPGSNGQSTSGHNSNNQQSHQKPYENNDFSSSNQNNNDYGRETNHDNSYSSSTRRPYSSSSSLNNGYSSSSSNNNYNNRDNEDDQYSSSPSSSGGRRTTRRPSSSSSSNNGNSWSNSNYERQKRQTNSSNGNNSTQAEPQEEQIGTRRLGDTGAQATKLFLRTGDTQPYCTYHYQVILELNEPFKGGKRPPMAIILQDSKPETGHQHQSHSGGEQNSLSNDEFGNKFNDRTYTHLLTSGKKLKRIDHGTLIFRNGLQDGLRHFKTLHINYMSHSDPEVRRKLSSRLCPVKSDTDRSRDQSNQQQMNRFYFEPCDKSQNSHHQSGHQHDNPNGSSSSNSGGNNHRDDEDNQNYGHSGGNHSGNQNSNYNNNHNGNHNNNQDNYGSSDNHSNNHNSGGQHSGGGGHNTGNHSGSGSSHNQHNGNDNYNSRYRNSSSYAA